MNNNPIELPDRTMVLPVCWYCDGDLGEVNYLWYHRLQQFQTATAPRALIFSNNPAYPIGERACPLLFESCEFQQKIDVATVLKVHAHFLQRRFRRRARPNRSDDEATMRGP